MATSSGRKITKSAKSRGSKPELSSAAVASLENELATMNESTLENKTEKKSSQAIVIDGKTYACATCKSGHRVGVCKHARERPMIPTHPPGRPAAGATKKIVCDCPRNCRCAKKDCKCPRQCACVQIMYILVYIPGLGELEHPPPENEKGFWKVSKEVTTDLKGKILSEEEIKFRREQKNNQKDCQNTPSSDGISQGVSNVSVPSNMIRSRSSSTHDPRSPSEAKSTSVGSCCHHAEAVQSQRSDPSSYTATIPRCDCGTACRCAFCPEHSNNATSHHAIRQQVNLYQQQHHFPLNTMNTTFDTGIAPGMSCMGGQPRFALSRHPAQFNLANFDHAFPTGGGSGAFMIAYPMHPKYAPMTPTMEAPPSQLLSQGVTMNGFIQPELMPSMQVPALMSELQDFGEYEIGEAVVANDGPNGWQQSEWPNHGLATPTPFSTFGEQVAAFAEESVFNDLISLPPWDAAAEYSDNPFSLGADGSSG